MRDTDTNENDGNSWENFTMFERDGRIDLSRTLAGAPDEILVKMAADFGVDTPGLLPYIPVMKSVLRESSQSALSNFERAVKEVYEHSYQSVALAASTLEGPFKAILKESQQGIPSKNDSLSKLSGKVVKELIARCDSSAPEEIRTLPFLGSVPLPAIRSAPVLSKLEGAMLALEPETEPNDRLDRLIV